MCTLYERIIALCEKKGVKGGKMCTDLGMSKATLTELKMGRQTGLSATKAQKIATYLGVSVGYLLGEEELDENTIKKDDTLSDIIIRATVDSELFELIQLVSDIPLEQRGAVKSILSALSSTK